MRRPLSPEEWADERGRIFGLYQQLGVRSDSERHRLQRAVTGCGSLRYMSRDEHRLLIRTLARLAETPPAERERAIRGLLALGEFAGEEDLV